MGWYKEYLRDLAEIKAAEDKKQGMWIGGVICGIIGLVCFIVAKTMDMAFIYYHLFFQEKGTIQR